jgi:epoxyqueuosine reductase
MARLCEELRQRAKQAGFAAVGIAPAAPMETTRRILEERKSAGFAGGMQFTYRNPARSTEPQRVVPGAAALVVGAWAYGDDGQFRGSGAAEDVPPGMGAPPGDDSRPKGTVARYARWDHYRDLEAALGTLVDLLKSHGWAARALADDNALVDRAAAQAAGIGWFGKNCNILLPRLGSWFLLGSVVTDAPLPPSNLVQDGCGACRRCLSSCPTGALVAPGVLDARKCLAWLLQAPGMFPFEYRVALGDRIYGCDDCQETCPANRAQVRPWPGLKPPAGDQPEATSGTGPGPGNGSEVDVLDMLAASGPELLARHSRWYIPHRDPRYLCRNALVVLANIGDGQSPAVGATLARYLSSADGMLRAHAVWAAARMGRLDLLARAPRLDNDPSPVVRQELSRQNEVVPRTFDEASQGVTNR